MSNGKVMAIVRIVALFVTAINALLTARGINPIPFNESLVAEVVCYIIAGVTALWAWWKNNNITPEAISAQSYLDKFKNHRGE